MDALTAYLPIDRRRALARGARLPERAEGAVLFADIAGFTPLTEGLVRELGPQRGAEELTGNLNRVYEGLVAAVHRHRGSVVIFGGDAITCFFAEDDGLRAAACALAIHEAMSERALVETPAGTRYRLDIKVALATGEVRRFLVGDPALRRMDAIAGRTLDAVAAAEKAAERGETLLTEAAATALGDRAELGGWRERDGARFAILAALPVPAAASPWPALDDAALDEDEVGAWLWPSLRERIAGGQREYLAELRPAVALFLQFGGIDYDRDPRAGQRLDALVRRVEAILDRHGGTMLEVSFGDKGSNLYACFGAPIAYADDASRAIGAALELLALEEELKGIRDLCVGLARGPMRAGAYGGPTRASYSVMGERTNLAARLMAAAEPGTILCDDAVADRARRHWELQTLEPMALKGMAAPVEVFRPTGRREEQAPRLDASGGALIGREDELATIRAALGEAEAGGQRVLGLVGEGGIGKSRLVAEVLREMRDRGLHASVGAGQSIERHTPYRAWRDVLREGFGLVELASATARRRRVETRIAADAPELLARVPLLEDILALGWEDNDLTAGLGPELRRDSLVDLVVSALRIWGQAQPCIVVLDDAQWLDDLSWDLAVDVTRGLVASDTPLLLLLALRPESEGSTAAQRIDSLRALGRFASLPLEGLDPEATVLLAAQKLGVDVEALPEDVSGLIRDRAEGNPFYAEELVLALRDQSLIRVDAIEDEGEIAQRVEMIGDLDDLEQALPTDVQGLVLARIDRLPAESQLVMKMASVIGRSFPLEPLEDTLAMTAGQSPEDVARSLDRLLAQDLTLLEAESPEPIYAFRHMITQETAYGTLLFEQRRAMHRTVASWYEGRYGAGRQPPPEDGMKSLEPYYPLLTHHYRRAEEPRRESIYGLLAGEVAASQFANEDALRYFERSAHLSLELDDREHGFRSLLGQESVLDRIGDREAQGDAVARIQQLSVDDDRPKWKFLAAQREAGLELSLSDYAASMHAANMSVTIARSALDVESEAAALALLGKAQQLKGEFDSSESHLRLALERYEEADSIRGRADTLRELGTIQKSLGRADEALAFYREALVQFGRLQDRLGVLTCIVSMAATLTSAGRSADANRYHEQALALCRLIGHRRGQSIIEGNIGADYFNVGQFGLAVESLQSALQTCRELGDRWGEGTTQDTLGLTYHYQGDLSAARAELESALAIQLDIEDQHGVGYTRTHLGDLLLDLGELEGAAEQHQAALDQRHALGQEAMAMDNHAGLARIALARGDLGEARAQVEIILRWIEQKGTEGMEFPVLVEWTCCRVLRETAAGDPADAALAEAALERAHALVRARAEGIADEELRRGFLENVPFNREVEAAWADRAGRGA